MAGVGSRVEVCGTLRAVSPMFVGAPNQSGPYDRMVVRDRDGVPFIPASTLRGALRASLEAQLLGLGRRAAAPRACGSFSRGGGARDGAALSCALEEGPCDVCRLFGSRGHAGKVTVWDAPLSGATGSQGTGGGEAVAGEGGDRGEWGDLRVAVPRHRDLGTARRENRVEWEVVRAGRAFEFRVEVAVSEEIDVGLVGIALDGLSHGVVAVGGGRGRGFGRVEVVVASARETDLAALVCGEATGDALETGTTVDSPEVFLARHRERVRERVVEEAANV